MVPGMAAVVVARVVGAGAIAATRAVRTPVVMVVVMWLVLVRGHSGRSGKGAHERLERVRAILSSGACASAAVICGTWAQGQSGKACNGAACALAWGGVWATFISQETMTK